MKDPPSPHPSLRWGRAPEGGPNQHVTPLRSGRAPEGGPRRPPLRVVVWTAATLALVVVAALLWRGSDAAATSSTTATASPVPVGQPADRLVQSWSTGSSPGPRRVVESGLVLTTSPTGVVLRDPGTGREAWHHTRANARLCDATAVDGVVVAVFRTADRCDEAVAFHASTGVRVWYRNVDFRGDARLSSAAGIVLASSPTGVATVDPTGNTLRWSYQSPTGCRLVGADVGSTGVVVLQRCTERRALQVKLFDGFDGDPLWTREIDAGGATARLAGADRHVDVVVADRLLVLSPADGTQLQDLPLPPRPVAERATPEPVQQAGMSDVALVWVRGTVYALDQATGAPRWQTAAAGLPSVSGTTAADAVVLVPEDGALVARSSADGAERARSVTDVALPAGGRTSVVGPTVVYATADRVLGLR
jgi:outer membrane protein assembly factor BamB